MPFKIPEEIWKQVKEDYLAGYIDEAGELRTYSFRALSEKYGDVPSRSALTKRARKEDWEAEWQRRRENKLAMVVKEVTERGNIQIETLAEGTEERYLTMRSIHMLARNIVNQMHADAAAGKPIDLPLAVGIRAIMEEHKLHIFMSGERESPIAQVSIALEVGSMSTAEVQERLKLGEVISKRRKGRRGAGIAKTG